MTGLLVVVGVLVLPDLLLTKLFPRWLARLAFRRMPPTRRFVLPEGPRAPADTAGYRDDALPRRHARLPLLPERLGVAPDVTLLRESASTFTLVYDSDLGWRARGFVVRIDAREERGEIVLRARQAPPFVVIPWIIPVAAGWLIRRNPPGATLGIVIATGLLFVILLVPWLLETTLRDRMTVLAMAELEREMRAAADAPVG